jgi:hypothetical protein
LPGWLTKAYFIFPVVLYIPDAIFNYYVYSDGAKLNNANPIFQAGQIALWGFLSVGVVGMAYLLSVLAPWHWGQGHKLQALFCGLGVLVATAITTWNSLSYRSTAFSEFPTDRWAYSLFPQLETYHVSVTMILVAVAPPFWGLFWAIVQPTQTGRSLAQLQESHAERLLRMQHEAELKRLRAETNAKVREAQLRGMAQTAAAAREQATGLLGQMRSKNKKADGVPEGANSEQGTEGANIEKASDAESTEANEEPAGILHLPQVNANRGHEPAGSRASFMNNVAQAQPAVHTAPAKGAQPAAAQPRLLGDADVQGSAGQPSGDAMAWGARRPPTLGGFGEMSDAEAMTGTSGPHHSVRSPAEVSPLMRSLGELRPAYAQAVQEAMRELNPNGTRRAIPAKDLAARVAAKLNMDEAMARQIIARYREQQKSASRS